MSHSPTMTPATAANLPAAPFACPACHDMRFVVPLVGGVPGRAVPCRCFQTDLAARRRETALEAGGLSPRLRALTFAAFAAAYPSQPVALAACRQFAADLRGWLLLSAGTPDGYAGRQVTHLAAAIANARLADGQPVTLTTTADLLDALRDTFDDRSYADTFRAVCRLPLLILTDLGCENRTPWAQEKLYQLFHARYLDDLPLVGATPLPLRQLDPRLTRLVHAHPACRALAL